jgi:hypothetical protein
VASEAPFEAAPLPEDEVVAALEGETWLETCKCSEEEKAAYATEEAADEAAEDADERAEETLDESDEATDEAALEVELAEAGMDVELAADELAESVTVAELEPVAVALPVSDAAVEERVTPTAAQSARAAA